MKKEKEKKKKKERRAAEEYGLREEPAVESRGAVGDAEALETIVTLVGGKWKMRILWALRDGEGKRYSNIKLSMPAITDMMLSQSLRELCAGGLVERRQYQEIPPRVEYVITQRGIQVVPALRELIEWARTVPKVDVKGK